MATTLPKIHALDKPASPDSFGVSNSPIGYFLAAWQGDYLVRLTLLPAHAEKELAFILPEYKLSVAVPQDDKRAKALVKDHLFPNNDWNGIPSSSLKLGFYGTKFQHEVLKQMLKITKGKTTSYGELGTKAGAARAGRAVGSICAKNPLSFLIPCHRILASGGNLGGYGHGKALKRQLLDWEKPKAE